jgi:hypothetical protein
MAFVIERHFMVNMTPLADDQISYCHSSAVRPSKQPAPKHAGIFVRAAKNFSDHARRTSGLGAADRGEHREAAGVIAEAVKLKQQSRQALQETRRLCLSAQNDARLR